MRIDGELHTGQQLGVGGGAVKVQRGVVGLQHAQAPGKVRLPPVGVVVHRDLAGEVVAQALQVAAGFSCGLMSWFSA